MKHFFDEFIDKWKFYQSILAGYGLWGIGLLSLIDSSSMPVFMDFFIGTAVWADQHHFWLYCIVAAAFSAVGGLLPYQLGRAGGEQFLLKRFDRERIEQMRARFERQEFLAMMIPSMLPPPTPWKAFVFAAGVFEMRIAPFMLSVFCGRLLRWLILSVLVLVLGPNAVQLVKNNGLTALAVVGGLSLAGFGVWWMRKKRAGNLSDQE